MLKLLKIKDEEKFLKISSVEEEKYGWLSNRHYGNQKDTSMDCINKLIKRKQLAHLEFYIYIKYI